MVTRPLSTMPGMSVLLPVLRRNAQPWWLLILLAAYAALELSFNHHLLQVSATAQPGLVGVEDLEFWARIISGLGLALWLTRTLLRRGVAPVLALLFSVAAGVAIMWHLQLWLVDHIVARASEQDLQMSLYSQQLVPLLLSGDVQVRGQSLVSLEQLPEAGLFAWQALVPAITLGLAPHDLAFFDMPADALATVQDHVLRDAYRRVVMVPIALGVSLLFGLANLCLLVSLALGRCCPARARVAPHHEHAAFLMLWLAVIAWSWLWLADEVETSGYREVTRPALRSEQPLLAPFVEWSLRAEPVWNKTNRWLHQVLLDGYAFRKPNLAQAVGV